MTDNVEGPEQPRPERLSEEAPAAARQPVLKTRWRDRAWTLWAMVAVAAASLIVGGLVGGFVGAAVSHDDHPGEHRMRPWAPGHGPGGFQRGGRGWRWDDTLPQSPGAPPYRAPNAPTPSPSTPPGTSG